MVCMARKTEVRRFVCLKSPFKTGAVSKKRRIVKKTRHNSDDAGNFASIGGNIFLLHQVLKKMTPEGKLRLRMVNRVSSREVDRSLKQEDFEELLKSLDEKKDKLVEKLEEAGAILDYFDDELKEEGVSQTKRRAVRRERRELKAETKTNIEELGFVTERIRTLLRILNDLENSGKEFSRSLEHNITDSYLCGSIHYENFKEDHF